MDKRIKHLEGQVPRHRPPSAEELAADRQAHREAIAKLEERCEQDEDPTNRRAAVADLAQFLRERGRWCESGQKTTQDRSHD